MHINKLTQIAQLTTLLSQYQLELQVYTNMAEQLSKDDCAFEFTITLHNMDIHRKQQALKHVHDADAAYSYSGGIINLLSGAPAKQPPDPATNKTQSCTTLIRDTLKESAALRIIAAIIKEKKEIIKELKHDLEQMLQVTENPIFSLHQ